jgi:hypothetical protein
MSFATALKIHFLSHPDLQEANPQIWKILSGRASGRRDRRVARMEQEVRNQLGMTPDATFDWSSVNWLLVVQWVAAILGILLLIV